MLRLYKHNVCFNLGFDVWVAELTTIPRVHASERGRRDKNSHSITNIKKNTIKSRRARSVMSTSASTPSQMTDDVMDFSIFISAPDEALLIDCESNISLFRENF
jgi:hypothetical protein